MSLGESGSLYLAGGLVVVLLIILMGQLFQTGPPPRRRHKVLVQTPKGVISSDPRRLASELTQVRRQLAENQGGASCQVLPGLIDHSIAKLRRFIRENPRDNTKALCALDLRAGLVHQHLTDSITPDSLDWEDNYRTILEHEEFERTMNDDPKQRLAYLVRNLDIVIALLNNELCDNGRIDLEGLHEILHRLAAQVCQTGASAIHFDANAHEYTRQKRLPTYLKHQYSIEPMASRETSHRGAPKPCASAGTALTGYTSTSDGSHVTVVDLRKTSRTANGDPGVVVARNRPAHGLLDDSIEGRAEQDINTSRHPGHSVGNIVHPWEHYSTRVGSCLGKTVSDADLLQECTTHDLSARRALSGLASPAIDHLEESWHH
jgi:hypothetical protein